MGFTPLAAGALAEPEPERTGFRPLPRPQRVRRTILDPTAITGTPEGTGTATPGAGGRVEEIERTVDPDAPLADVPAPKALPAAPAEVRRPVIERQVAEGGRLSPLWDVYEGSSPSELGTPARERTALRVSRLWEGAQRDPWGTAAAVPVALGEGLSGGVIPEITAASEVPGVLFDPAGLVSESPERFGEALRSARTDMARLRDVNPEAFTGAETAGMAGLALGGPVSVARAGAGTGARMAAAGRTGAAYGALGGIGAADPETLEEAAVEGGVGGGLGFLLGGAAEGALAPLARAQPATLERLGRWRDETLLGATTSAGRGQSAIDRFSRGATPRAITQSRARAAETLRGTGAIPRMGSVGTVAQRIDDAFERATQVMDDIRGAMDGGGPTYREVAEALRARAASIRGVEGQPLREMLEARASQYSDMGHQTMDYDLLVQESANLRAMGMGRTRTGTIPLGQQALQHVDETLRGAYDDAVEVTLGAADRARYQQARRQYATLLTAGMNAGRGMAASAGNRLFGMSEQQGAIAGAVMGGEPGAGIGALGAATLRRYEPTLHATLADRIHQLAQRQVLPPELSRAIIDAASRSPAALITTIHSLANRDARMRAVIAEQQEQQEEESDGSQR